MTSCCINFFNAHGQAAQDYDAACIQCCSCIESTSNPHSTRDFNDLRCRRNTGVVTAVILASACPSCPPGALLSGAVCVAQETCICALALKKLACPENGR